MPITVRSLPSGPFASMFTANLAGKGIPASGKVLLTQQTVRNRDNLECLPRTFPPTFVANGGRPGSHNRTRLLAGLRRAVNANGGPDVCWVDYEAQWMYDGSPIDRTAITLMSDVASIVPSRFVNWRFDDIRPFSDSRFEYVKAGYVPGKDVGIEVYVTQGAGEADWLNQLDAHLDMADALNVPTTSIRAFWVPVLFTSDGSAIARSFTPEEAFQHYTALSERNFGSIYCWGGADTLTQSTIWSSYYTPQIVSAILGTEP